MMKSLVLGAIAGLVFVGVASLWTSTGAKADNGPHILDQPMTTDACAGCHRAHRGQAGYLLKAPEEQLCLTCHDGSGATTNVKNGVSTGGGGLRAGGFETAAIDTEDQTWRFSVSCEGGPTLPGWPDIACTGTARITFCGSGTVVPSSPPPNNSGTVSGTNPNGGQCLTNVPSTAAWYANPGGWFLKIGVLGTPETTNSNHGIGSPAGTIVWGAGPHSAAPVPGLAIAAGDKLECTSCHNPHGSGQYRILRPNPATMIGLTGTFPGGVSLPDTCPTGQVTSCTPVPATDPTRPNGPYLYTTANYIDSTYEWYTSSSVDGGAPGSTTTMTGMSAFCAQCHSRYLAQSVFNTNSGDAIFRFRHSTESSASYNGRQCNTCHAVHGSNSTTSGFAAGVEYPDGTSRPANNNSLLKMDNRGMCVKCHKRP